MRRFRLPLFLLTLLASPIGLIGQDSSPREIEEIKDEIKKQQLAIEQQSRNLSRLLNRLEAIEQRQPSTAKLSAPSPALPPKSATNLPATTPVGSVTTSAVNAPSVERDPVGDLNAAQVAAGDFPGSVKLPGKDISLGISGFVKTLIFHDTNAEGRKAIFLPALLGSSRDDRDGTTSLSAELSRLSFDARAKAGDSTFRGYVEFDFVGDKLNLRHAYMTWDDRWGQLLAGKYWSNFMDLQALPEGLSEPTLSGAVFTRQAQFRYTRILGRGLKLSTSLEDSSSSDITAAAPVNTRSDWPDFTFNLNHAGERSHIQIAGLLRQITVDPDHQRSFGATGWGVHAGGHLNVGSKDKLVTTFVYGKGLGRYLLGVLPTAAAFVDVDARSISARSSFGAVGTIRHQWNEPCRSNAGVGYASVKTDPLQPDAALRASLYGLANYLCTVHRYMTIGVEYDYGRRRNKVGNLDNNRFMFGMQIF